MSPKMNMGIVYENNLDTDKFARMFNNKAQSYKFYWFEAILNLTMETDEDLSFEDVIDEMICEAWHTVTHYHLRLGPTVNGNAENFLEHAINTLNHFSRPIREIYTGREIGLDVLSIDHFVPRSYISNDELWNLTPMSKSLNSSKNNRLPSWDEYFEPFAHYQYYLYSLVFPEDESKKSAFLIDKFEKCRKNNVNAIWASEALYIPGNTKTQFVNILSHNLKPIYESAQMQGYDMWNMKV